MYNKKMASYLYRTATTIVPLLYSYPGGLDRSWSYKTCHCKVTSRLHTLQKIVFFLLLIVYL